MAKNSQKGDSPPTYLGLDNAAYQHPNEGRNDPSSPTIPFDPAPHAYLPRIAIADGAVEPVRDIGFVFPPEEKTDSPGGIAVISGSKENEDEEGEEDRDTWDNPIEFLMSCISMSVGLGNIWRFPGVAARNGGGAFLFPYILVVLFIGRPLYYLEMCMGQFSRFGQVKVWNMAPFFKGVGYGSNVGVVCEVVYYVQLMAITVYYFFASFAKTLPWTKCHQDKHPGFNCSDERVQDSLPAFYYNSTVIPLKANIDDGLGQIHWKLLLCLIFSWLLIFLTLARGVKSSGKVAYFTAIFPYVVLIILLIRGVTLKGAWTGIRIFLEPQWKELYNPKVWYAAVEQCFFSLTAGFGPVIMFSSYNKFTQNIYRDVAIISIMDTGTSLLAGITIFSVIGNLMEENGLDYEEVREGGPALAFIIYPQAIAKFGNGASQFFAVLFFLMLFTLGVGSATSLAGGVITIICDQFRTWKRWIVTLGVCLVGCTAGLMFVTEGGNFMVDLIDHYGVGVIIYIMTILETTGVCYVYGLKNICKDIQFMIGHQVGIYWKVCWAIIIPIGLSANLIYYLASQDEFTSGGVPYPKVATICGWLLTAFAVAMFPIWAVHGVATRKAFTWKGKLKESFKPTRHWGPQKKKLRREWEEFKKQTEIKLYPSFACGKCK